MSRRRERASIRAERAAGQGAGAGAEAGRGTGAPGRQPPRISFAAQAGILIAVFAVVSLIADLAGAANLGVALGVGQIAFAIALVVLIVKT
jgi:hypothetical protein